MKCPRSFFSKLLGALHSNLVGLDFYNQRDGSLSNSLYPFRTLINPSSPLISSNTTTPASPTSLLSPMSFLSLKSLTSPA